MSRPSSSLSARKLRPDDNIQEDKTEEWDEDAENLRCTRIETLRFDIITSSLHSFSRDTKNQNFRSSHWWLLSSCQLVSLPVLWQVLKAQYEPLMSETDVLLEFSKNMPALWMCRRRCWLSRWPYTPCVYKLQLLTTLPLYTSPSQIPKNNHILCMSALLSSPKDTGWDCYDERENTTHAKTMSRNALSSESLE